MGVAIDKMSFDAYVTKDGQWVQLLGVDYKVHVPRVFKALGISYGKVFNTLISSLTKISSPLELVPVMFYEVTDNIRNKMLEMTYNEVKACFAQHNVWYTTVASPEQAICNEQAIITQAFRWKDGVRNSETLLVNSPCQMTFWKRDSFEYGRPDSVKDSY
jgi:crotonobetainyl-CoA:carnitine CoA-transferase CaiB-like acyl-CoA transferase